MIKCYSCKETKGEESFWKGQTLCKTCAKHYQKNHWASRTPKKRLEQHLKYKYGITKDVFDEAWEAQNGNCAICQSELPDLMTYDNRRRGYAIDHNHETKEFRGILCINCNSMLGMAKDCIDILMSAAAYLESKGSYRTMFPKGRKKVLG